MARANSREVLEGVQYQGVDEEIVYTLDVLAISDTQPHSVYVVVKNITNGTSATADVMPVNAPTVSGSVITLSPLTTLALGTLYRVEVRYIMDGNALESYFYVQTQE